MSSVYPYGVGGIGSVTSRFQVLSCSEFQKPSQTTAERGEAKLCILDVKTTWSEFQKHCQTPAVIGRHSQGTFFVQLPRVSPKQLCALVHQG